MYEIQEADSKHHRRRLDLEQTQTHKTNKQQGETPHPPRNDRERRIEATDISHTDPHMGTPPPRCMRPIAAIRAAIAAMARDDDQHMKSCMMLYIYVKPAYNDIGILQNCPFSFLSACYQRASSVLTFTVRFRAASCMRRAIAMFSAHSILVVPPNLMVALRPSVPAMKIVPHRDIPVQSRHRHSR